MANSMEYINSQTKNIMIASAAWGGVTSVLGAYAGYEYGMQPSDHDAAILEDIDTNNQQITGLEELGKLDATYTEGTVGARVESQIAALKESNMTMRSELQLPSEQEGALYAAVGAGGIVASVMLTGAAFAVYFRRSEMKKHREQEAIRARLHAT